MLFSSWKWYNYNRPVTNHFQEVIVENATTWFQVVLNGAILRFKTQKELAEAIREYNANSDNLSTILS